MWRRVLSDDEIGALASMDPLAGGPPPIRPGLVARYLTANVARDTGTSDHDGVVNGGTWDTT